tara:strand:- start:247 stop:435 length:189 start_codon:yes stop_codon:yes gene_type:complete
MNKTDIDKLLSLRIELINKFDRLRDYKHNKNAIMKEIEHAKLIHETVVKLDGILKDHVTFKK